MDNGPSKRTYNAWDNGANTLDKVFLLHSSETDKYVGTTDDHEAQMEPRATPTEYAKQQGDSGLWDEYVTLENKVSGSWWLRSSGNMTDDKNRKEVKSYGREAVMSHGTVASVFVSMYYFVRPALWIDLESGIF